MGLQHHAASERKNAVPQPEPKVGLIKRARQLYAEEGFGQELKQTVYAFDSTIIDLCLSLFPWARFRRTKAAVKRHTLMNLCGSIPVFIAITDGKIHDVNVLNDI